MIFIEPQEDFEGAILFILNDIVYYDYDSLVYSLQKDYIDAGEEDPEELALTWLSYNIIPSLPYLGEKAPHIVREFDPQNMYLEDTKFILANDKMWEIYT
jgi:hypothetical protein